MLLMKVLELIDTTDISDQSFLTRANQHVHRPAMLLIEALEAAMLLIEAARVEASTCAPTSAPQPDIMSPGEPIRCPEFKRGKNNPISSKSQNTRKA